MDEAQANRALVRHAYDLFAQGRIDDFIAMLDDDFAIHEVDSLPYGGVHRGRAGFAALMAEISTRGRKRRARNGSSRTERRHGNSLMARWKSCRAATR